MDRSVSEGKMRIWVVEGKWPNTDWYVLRAFTDGADAGRFAQSKSGPPKVRISIITDASLGGPHVHFWTLKSWSWDNYRWEGREPRADCIPLKDGCVCGETREHVSDTPWPAWADFPEPSADVVRIEAGPRPRASRKREPAWT